MILVEVKEDMLALDDKYFIVHCIGGDYAMGVGTTKRIDEKYNMRFELFKNYRIPIGARYANVGKALVVGKVINLVTKETRYDRATYANLRSALENLREICDEVGIQKLAMTALGSGRDGLEWAKVKDIIEEIFMGMDIEIVICRY